MRDTAVHSWSLMEYADSVDINKINEVFDDIDLKIYQTDFFTTGLEVNDIILTRTSKTKQNNSYYVGMRAVFIASTTNTGQMTANVDGLGSVIIEDTSSAGSIISGNCYTIVYDGVNFKIESFGELSSIRELEDGISNLEVEKEPVIIKNTGFNKNKSDSVASTSTDTLATSLAVKTAYDLANTKQDALGYTPVQQGTGTGQSHNVVKIGWTGSELNLEVGTTNMGKIYTEYNKPTPAEIGAQPSGTYNTVIGTDTDINTSGATIIDNIYVTDGVITSMGTRTLTASDIGALFDNGSSFATNGYQKLSNGLIIQWGMASAAFNSFVTHSFPLTFPNACLHCSGSFASHTSIGAGDGDAAGAFYISTSQFKTYAHDVVAAKINWVAIGY